MSSRRTSSTAPAARRCSRPRGLADPEQRSTFFGKATQLMAGQPPRGRGSQADGAAYFGALAGESDGRGRDHRLLHGRPHLWRPSPPRTRIASPPSAGFHTGGLVTGDPDSPHLGASASCAPRSTSATPTTTGSITPENIATFELPSREATFTSRSEVFEGAAHGYTMSDTPAYDQAAAERHFTELFALLIAPSPLEGRHASTCAAT